MTEWWANVYVYTHVEHGKFCDGAQRRLSRFRADCEAEEAPDRNRFRIHVRLKAPNPSQTKPAALAAKPEGEKASAGEVREAAVIMPEDEWFKLCEKQCRLRREEHGGSRDECLGEYEDGICPECEHDAIAAAGNSATAQDWRDDPSADDRWNAGLDYGQQQLCHVLGVDPQSVSWDAATETLDGDVRAVIGNILTAWAGDDWRDVRTAPVDEEKASAGEECTREIEALAEHLHEERDYGHQWTWPTHSDDDGYRGGGYVTITPPDVQARLREEAARILIRVDQLRSRAAALTTTTGSGGRAEAPCPNPEQYDKGECCGGQCAPAALVDEEAGRG